MTGVVTLNSVRTDPNVDPYREAAIDELAEWLMIDRDYVLPTVESIARVEARRKEQCRLWASRSCFDIDASLMVKE